jgi:hypothetical protein
VLDALLDVLRVVLMRCDALGRGFPNAMAIDQGLVMGNVGARTMRKPFAALGKKGFRPRAALPVAKPDAM